jgi:hypothetical protein
MYNNRPSVKNKTKKSKTEQAAANEKNHLAKARILEIERI